MDDRGVTAPVGAILLAAIMIALAAGAAMIVKAPSPSAAPIDAAARARIIDGDHVVTLTGPDDVPLEGSWIEAETADGAVHIDLSSLATQTNDGRTWRVGESLCLSGRGPPCALSAPTARITVYSPHQMLFTLRFDGGGPAITGPAGPAVPPPAIETCFDILASGTVETDCALSWTSYVVGSEITQGTGGPKINTYLSARPDPSVAYVPTFGGSQTAAGASEWLGQWPANSRIGLMGEARLGPYYRSYESDVADPHVKVLRDGDSVPDATGYTGQVPVGALLAPYTENGTINIGPHEVIVLFEFNDDLASPAADFQDLVVLLQAAHVR